MQIAVISWSLPRSPGDDRDLMENVAISWRLPSSPEERRNLVEIAVIWWSLRQSPAFRYLIRGFQAKNAVLRGWRPRGGLFD